MQYFENAKESFLFSKYRNVILAFTGVAVCALVVAVAFTTLSSHIENSSDLSNNLLEFSSLNSGQSEIALLKGERFDEDIIVGNVLELEDRAPVMVNVLQDEDSVGGTGQAENNLVEEVSAPLEPTTAQPQVTTVSVEPTASPVKPLVTIAGQGRIRGTTHKTRKNKNYYTFYNIPYARPPTSSFRFELPRPPKRWYRERDGTKPGPQCMQRDKNAQGNATLGQEDCLYLNVHTPELPKEGTEHPNLPVLFYIHGGGVHGNGTRYMGTYLLDERVILVTLEFRMGVFGGFTTGTSDYPGNMALKDQVMALKWVQKNIERFGGDPRRVLIFGNSSGSGDVHAHILSAMSSGLFHYAVMQSGTTITKDETILNTKELLHDFLTEVNCVKYENRTTRRLMDCLKSVSAKEIALSEGQSAFGLYAAEPIPSNGDLTNVFLPDHPWNLLNAGVVNNVPVIIGMNSLEQLGAATILLDTKTVDLVNKDWNTYLPSVVGIPDDSNHTMANKFREVYFGDDLISNETREDLVNLMSDASVHPCRITGLIQAEQSPGSVYFYWLNKPPPRSYAAKVTQIFPTPRGAAHADELQFLFQYDDYPVITPDSPSFTFSETLVRLWVSFAATGRPISPTTEWLPIDAADNGLKWFQLDDKLEYVEPITNRMLLWDEYTTELYEVN